MDLSIIENEIFLIEKEVSRLWKSERSLSLFTGMGGIPVFYYLLFKLTQDEKYLRIIRQIVEEIFDRINDQDYSLTYSDGLTGVSFMLNFLKEKDILSDNEIDESLVFLDKVICDYIKDRINTYKDIDFLHGGLGIANYLLKRYQHNSEIKETLISTFNKIADINDLDISKTDTVRNLKEYNDETHRTNCGLAHGHISTIIIFSKFLKEFPNNEKIRFSLKKSVECILNFQSDSDDTLAIFPSIACNRSTASYKVHLGWCYGDQTASLGLYRAAQILDDPSLEKISIDISKKTMKRGSVQTAFISPYNDGGFCHGVSSVAYLHKKWYQITGNPKHIKLYEIFIEELLKKGKNKNQGIAGYRKVSGFQKHENAIGLLDGVVGIGVVLIDYLLNDSSIEWDQFFLLE